VDTKKLAVFVDLAETQNYSRSAERLFLSQSTVSKDILALERAWQVSLFSRAHRQVHLTAAGKLILPRVKAVLRQEDDLRQVIAGQAWREERPLVIQGLPSLPQYRAFQLITAFTKRYPKIRLQFNEAGVDQLEHALDRSDVDVVFTRLFAAAPPTNDTLVTDHDQVVVLVPQAHRLAHQATITVAQLQGEANVLQSDTISKLSPLSAVFQQMGAQPQIAYNGRRIDFILEMINQGAGVSVVMSKAFDLTGYPNIRAIPLAPTVANQLAFMKRRENTAPVVDLFWQFIAHESQLEKS